MFEIHRLDPRTHEYGLVCYSCTSVEQARAAIQTLAPGAFRIVQVSRVVIEEVTTDAAVQSPTPV